MSDRQLHLNLINGSGENWYGFVSVRGRMADEFGEWMHKNLPNCRTIRFTTPSGEHFEIQGTTDAERLLFTMRWS